MLVTLKIEEDTMQELRIRKAQFNDKSYDVTIKNMLGMSTHKATVLNPAPISLDELNKRNTK